MTKIPCTFLMTRYMVVVIINEVLDYVILCNSGIILMQFGEAAPDLLKDYNVPHLFQEDYFDVLNIDQRPPFRWLIIGPERSGASWHVDPGLTSAWNTLLCGRKRYLVTD